ncbi:chemotaxis protein CheW (plasmid) [Tundrisphaera lichenicola]|uniref:chemotaxis protein CheW n=1 Tax=Tundrisphaera lichenicola TaxID=2029860 RepID=UPI003EC02961
MLVLMFRVADVRYAVAVKRVAEVVPRVGLRALPHAPCHLVGLLHYRGGVVPVVDLGVLMGGDPCRERLDTRIVVLDVGGEAGGMVGLVAERVDDVRKVDESRKAIVGIEVEGAPYLGSVFEVEDGLLQLIEPGRILGGLSVAEVRVGTP